MAIWPFNRNQSEETYDQPQGELPVEQPASNLPEEVKEYYESGKRERVGVAWLLGLGTLLVTLLLATTLFFGGRWVYRKVANRDNKPSTTSQIGQDSKSKSQTKSNSGSSSSTNSGSTAQKPSTSQNKPNTAAPTTPTPAPTTAPSSTQPKPATPTPVAQTPATTVPNTGPGDVIAIAAATAVASTAGFYIVQLRREN